METTKTEKRRIRMTTNDLKVMALTLLRNDGSQFRIGAIRKLRDLTADIEPISLLGTPFLKQKHCFECDPSRCDHPAEFETLTRFGLVEIRDAVNFWFDGRTFLG